MKILFAASECAPLAKSGGLGDVIGALPKQLQQLGLDVRVILPKYADIPERFKRRMEQQTVAHWQVQLGWRAQYCGIQQLEADGIVYYFVDNEYYFKRSGLYGYGDEAERYAFFCLAVMEALPRIEFQPDVLHSHDWQTGLIPYLMKNKYRNDPFYAQTRSVFTIHNLMYQGVFGEELLRDLLDVPGWDESINSLSHHGGVSCLKGGLVNADRITTVSQTYANEIQTTEYGENMDGLLRDRSGDLRGIVNGIDYGDYDPATDEQLSVSWRQEEPDWRRWKRENKQALQREVGLRQLDDTPVIAMVTRLVEQKGLDLVMRVLHDIMQENVQLVVLGTGDAHYEHWLRAASEQYPGSISVNLRFDEGLARRIYAGSELFLMPSRFEPCGIGQLLALRYRTIPIVRETGGLKDTVMPYNEFTGEGWGFSFQSYNAHDMLFTIRRALTFYQSDVHWSKLHANAEVLDYSWRKSAEAYAELYQELNTGMHHD